MQIRRSGRTLRCLYRPWSRASRRTWTASCSCLTFSAASWATSTQPLSRPPSTPTTFCCSSARSRRHNRARRAGRTKKSRSSSRLWRLAKSTSRSTGARTTRKKKNAKSTCTRCCQSRTSDGSHRRVLVSWSCSLGAEAWGSRDR